MTSEEEHECTCETDGEANCLKVWHCCDCKRDMRHKYGDLFARCWQCWGRIESNL